jgi:hypothetical protein
MIYSWLNLNGVDFTPEVRFGCYGNLYVSIAQKINGTAAIRFICEHYEMLKGQERKKLLKDMARTLKMSKSKTEKLIQQTINLNRVQEKKQPTEARTSAGLSSFLYKS